MALEPAGSFERQRRLAASLGLALLVLSPLFFFRPLEDAYVLPQRIAALLGLSLAFLGLQPQAFNRSPILLAALLFFAWRIFTQGVALGDGSTLPWVVAQLTPLATLVLVAHAAREAAWRVRLIRLAFLSAGLVSLYALIQLWGLDPWESGAVNMGFLQRAHGSMGNPDFLAGFLILLLPGVLLGYLSRPAGWRASLPALGFTLLLGAVLLLTQVRGAWLAALLGIGVALMAARGRWPWSRLGLLLVLGLGLVLFFSRPGRLSPTGVSPWARVQQSSGDGAWSGRRFMARVGWKLLLSHPAMGVGPGHFQDAYLEAQGALLSQAPYAAEPYRFTADIHDDWLQTGAESGVLGLGLLLAVFILALRSAWRQRRWEGAALLGLLVSMGIQALFHFPFNIQASSLFFWGAVGLCAAQEAPVPADQEKLPWAWLALPLVLGLVLTGRQALGSAALNSGTSLDEAGHPKLGAALLQAATRLWPEDQRAWMRLGILQDKFGDDEAAVESFEHAASIRPGLPEAWSNLGLALGKLNRLADAQAASEQALSLNPRAGEAWSNLAKLRYLAGQPQEALRDLEGGIAQAGPSPILYFNLGAVHLNLGQRKEAREAFQHCLALDPSHAEAKRLLQSLGRAP